MPVEVMARRGSRPCATAPEAPGPPGPQDGEGALRRGPAPAGQRGGQHLQPGGLSDPPDLAGAEAGVLHDPRPEKRGVCPLRGDAPEHLSGLPPSAGPVLPGEESPGCLRRPDDRGGGLCGVHRLRAAWRLWSWPGVWRKEPINFPQETAIGALALYVSNETVASFQPMNVNFGIMPPLGYRVKGKRNKNAALIPAGAGAPGGAGPTVIRNLIRIVSKSLPREAHKVLHETAQRAFAQCKACQACVFLMTEWHQE